MQGQGRKFVEGPLIELRRIDHIPAGNALLRTAAEIPACGVGVLDISRDWPDTIGEARQGREPYGQFIVDALGDPRSFFQKVFPRGRIEFGITPQIGLEALKVALKACLSNDPIHLLADASDLRQADLMNVIRAQGCRGAIRHQPFVIGLTPRNAPYAQGFAASWQVFRLEEGHKGALGWTDLIGNDGHGFLTKAIGVSHGVIKGSVSMAATT